MNNKKIVAGLLALTFVLGGAALPNKVVSNNAVILATISTLCLKMVPLRSQSTSVLTR